MKLTKVFPTTWPVIIIGESLSFDVCAYALCDVQGGSFVYIRSFYTGFDLF